VELQRRIPELQFLASDQKQQSQLVYTQDLEVSEVLSHSMEPTVNLTASSATETDTDTCSDRLLNKLPTTFQQKFSHVCQAIKSSLEQKVPKTYNNWPPSLEDFTLESSMKYAPDELFNFIASVTGQSFVAVRKFAVVAVLAGSNSFPVQTYAVAVMRA